MLWGTKAQTGRQELRDTFGAYDFGRFPRVLVYTKPPHFARRFGASEIYGEAHKSVYTKPAGLARPLWPQVLGVYLPALRPDDLGSRERRGTVRVSPD